MVVQQSWRDWLWRRSSELMLLQSFRESDSPWQERALVLFLLFAMAAWISRVCWRMRDYWAAASDSPPNSPRAASPQPSPPAVAIALPRRSRRD